MRAPVVLLAAALGCASPTLAPDPAETFPTSLHATRAGKLYWYRAAAGGFERWTGVGMDALGCRDCHPATDADGEPYADPFPGASCSDCHAGSDRSVSEERCYGCHGRQRMEARRLQLPDVHRDAGMKCWDCHPSEDIHGDGTAYQSMLEPGAVKVSCLDCHRSSDLPAEHAAHDPHGGALHCTACHSSSVVTCYNCHFESQVEARVRRAMQPLAGFVLLVNRTADGTVRPASFQSLTYRGRSFVAVAPYTPHTTVARGRRCGECHLGAESGGSAAVSEYRRSGAIRLVSWDPAARSLVSLTGVIPVPPDYRESLRMDFMTFDGELSALPGPDAGSWSPTGVDTPDDWQMLFATPLSDQQMAALQTRVDPATHPAVVESAAAAGLGP